MRETVCMSKEKTILNTFTSSGARNVPRFGANIKYDCSLKPRYQEVHALPNSVSFHTL